jgi:hypothetical protein
MNEKFMSSDRGSAGHLIRADRAMTFIALLKIARLAAALSSGVGISRLPSTPVVDAPLTGC